MLQDIQQYHWNNQFRLDQDDTDTQDDDNYFLLMIAFQTLDVEQIIESVEFDFGTLLAAAGGNLGLFLGLSVASVAFATINLFKKFALERCCKE